MTNLEPLPDDSELPSKPSHLTLLKDISLETAHNGTVHRVALIKQGEAGQLATWNLAWLEPGDKLEEHVHDDCHEYFLFSGIGSGTMTVADEVMDVSVAGLVTVNPNERHSLEATGDAALHFQTVRAFVKSD